MSSSGKITDPENLEDFSSGLLGYILLLVHGGISGRGKNPEVKVRFGLCTRDNSLVGTDLHAQPKMGKKGSDYLNGYLDFFFRSVFMKGVVFLLGRAFKSCMRESREKVGRMAFWS